MWPLTNALPVSRTYKPERKSKHLKDAPDPELVSVTFVRDSVRWHTPCGYLVCQTCGKSVYWGARVITTNLILVIAPLTTIPPLHNSPMSIVKHLVSNI